MLVSDFQGLGESLRELKEDYDSKIGEVNMQCQSVQKKIQDISDGVDTRVYSILMLILTL